MDIQDKFSDALHIYKITTPIDLNGETLTIPSSCTLDFQGGEIINGTVVLDNTRILPNGCIISDYITAEISGTYRKGQCLFDATSKKPIWWTGEKWVDATGADVDATGTEV